MCNCPLHGLCECLKGHVLSWLPQPSGPPGAGEEGQQPPSGPTGAGKEEQQPPSSPTGGGEEEQQPPSSPTGAGEEEQQPPSGPTGAGEEEQQPSSGPQGAGEAVKPARPSPQGRPSRHGRGTAGFASRLRRARHTAEESPVWAKGLVARFSSLEAAMGRVNVNVERLDASVKGLGAGNASIAVKQGYLVESVLLNRLHACGMAISPLKLAQWMASQLALLAVAGTPAEAELATLLAGSVLRSVGSC